MVNTLWSAQQGCIGGGAPEFLFNQPTNTQSRSGLFGSWPQITEFWTDLAGCGQQPLAWVPLKLFKLLSPLSWVWGFWHFKTVKMQKLKFSGCCHVLAGRWQAWSIGVFPQLHLEVTPRLHGQQHVTNTHVPITALAYTSSVFAFHWQSWFLVILKSNFFLGVKKGHTNIILFNWPCLTLQLRIL